MTVPACGLARLPDRAFLPGLIVGSSIFLALHFLIGYIGGPVVRGALAAVGVPVLALLLALLGIGLAGWLLIRRRAVGHGTDAATATLEGARDWADACCPVCLALGAAHALPLLLALVPLVSPLVPLLAVRWFRCHDFKLSQAIRYR